MTIDIHPLVIDNAIPKNLQEEVKEELKENAMWYFSKSAVGSNVKVDANDTNIEETPQMVHGLIHENQSTSPLSHLSDSICNHVERMLDLEVKNTLRAKANLLMKDEGSEGKYQPPHMDVPNKDCISIVYYVEDSDGDTVIFDKTVDKDPIDLNIVDTVEPKQGRIAVFPSRVFHASKKPTQNDTRTIINFILQTDRAKIVDMFGI